MQILKPPIACTYKRHENGGFLWSGLHGGSKEIALRYILKLDSFSANSSNWIPKAA